MQPGGHDHRTARPRIRRATLHETGFREGPAKAEFLHRPVVIGAADPALAALLTDAIGTDGFEVRLADNSEAVVTLVAAIQRALVLVEDSVGAMDGQATCRAIRPLPAAECGDTAGRLDFAGRQSRRANRAGGD